MGSNERYSFMQRGGSYKPQQQQQQHENPAASNPIEGQSSSTERWNDVPHGTMDEVSSYVRLNLQSH
jgi:hypothetical protein